MTEKHAKEIKDNERLRSVIPADSVVEYVIAETDGTMIPIADIRDEVTGGDMADRRRTRKGRWKEARLTLTRPEGSVNPFFGCTPGSPDEAGGHLLNCAIRSGPGQNTKVHCVGDGAPWVAGQADQVFGEQSGFLIDFYHLCDYLSSALKICAPDDYANFSDRQKQLMKENQVSVVPEELRPHIEPDSVPDEKAPVRCCHRYVRNRPGQSDYKGASENGLPTGPGEIESAHRYIIQKRLKIAGVWWKEDNAQNIISLRVLRANGDWEDYWKNKKAA
ncbi:UPF0236 family transposase-like protein [Desulfonema magnum]|nr:UPF0236 family protein [Desulfonema magnum]